jgi:hypothetical protein
MKNPIDNDNEITKKSTISFSMSCKNTDVRSLILQMTSLPLRSAAAQREAERIKATKVEPC